MPQTFQVLKCYKCSIFQVILAKKSNKWECRLCGEKQSIKRHYGIGTAPECRGHVQKLNLIQRDKNETVTKLKELDSDDEKFEYMQKEKKLYNSKIKSKWSAFIDENDDNSDVDNQNDDSSDIPIQVSKKRKYEVCKTEISEEEHARPNIFSESKEKKHILQEAMLNPNKWSAFVSDDVIPINSKNISLQVPKTQKHELYETKSNVDEYEKPNSFNCIKSKKKKYPIQGYNLKSNKWSAYVSDDENANQNFCKASRRHIDDGKEEMTYENRDLSVNESLETPKESTVTENSEPKWPQFVTNTTQCDDEDNTFKKEKQRLFSLCDDNDLDSILDF